MRLSWSWPWYVQACLAAGARWQHAHFGVHQPCVPVSSLRCVGHKPLRTLRPDVRLPMLLLGSYNLCSAITLMCAQSHVHRCLRGPCCQALATAVPLHESSALPVCGGAELGA